MFSVPVRHLSGRFDDFSFDRQRCSAVRAGQGRAGVKQGRTAASQTLHMTVMLAPHHFACAEIVLPAMHCRQP